MPGDATALASALGSPQVKGRLYATTVTLSSGSATLTYTDVDGIESDPANEPYIAAIGTNAGQAVGVTSKGTSQATLDDGSGSTSNDVEVLILVPEQ
jgi:hypothetical protein